MIIGKVVSPKPTTEAEHFLRCADCGGYFDIRDLAQVSTTQGLYRTQRTPNRSISGTA